jgi:hypothetical protein
MGYTIADAVNQVLEEMHFLQEAFRHDVVNYSALARLIKPLVDERVGSPSSLDAVIMGIRRYAASAAQEGDGQPLHKVLKDVTITLRTDVGAVYFRHWRTPEFLNRLAELELRSVDWNAGEKIYVVQRSGEMAVIANTKFLPEILDLPKRSPQTTMLARKDNLAILTVAYPPEGIQTPGLFTFLAGKLSSGGINLLANFSTYRKMSFVIPGEDVSKAYQRLSDAISMARRLNQVLAEERPPRMLEGGEEAAQARARTD